LLPGNLQTQQIARLQRAALHGRIEQQVEPLDVRRQQRPQVPDVPRGRSAVGIDALCQQDAFGDVQPLEVPRLQVVRQIAAQQPEIHELLFFLVRQQRCHHLAEELRILVVQEEVQFMARKLGNLGPFFVVRQIRPPDDEAEFGQFGIAAERRVQRVDLGQAIVQLEA
jgi:hypothetical protein